jgi:hypothetical protein
MQQQRSTRRRASATARHPRDPAVRSRRGVGAACEDFLLDPLGLGAPGRCQDYAPLATGRRSSTAPVLLRAGRWGVSNRLPVIRGKIDPVPLLSDPQPAEAAKPRGGLRTRTLGYRPKTLYRASAAALLSAPKLLPAGRRNEGRRNTWRR